VPNVVGPNDNRFYDIDAGLPERMRRWERKPAPSATDRAENLPTRCWIDFDPSNCAAAVKPSPSATCSPIATTPMQPRRTPTMPNQPRVVRRNGRTQGRRTSLEKANLYHRKMEARERLVAEAVAALPLDPATNPEMAGRYRRLFELLVTGASMSDAIAISFVPDNTFRGWMRKGGDAAHNKGEDKTDDAEEPYRSFALAVRKLQAHVNANLVEKVATSKEWQAAAWLLERRDPANYGKRRLSIDLTGDDTAPANVAIYIPASGRNAQEEVNSDPPPSPSAAIDAARAEEV
jgi:hypothetical protein